MKENLNSNITVLGCPAGCGAKSSKKLGKLTFDDFKRLLTPTDFEKYEWRNALNQFKELRGCWTPDCLGAFDDKPGMKNYSCGECLKSYCLKCQILDHPE
jgi:hypothetical protein